MSKIDLNQILLCGLKYKQNYFISKKILYPCRKRITMIQYAERIYNTKSYKNYLVFSIN